MIQPMHTDSPPLRATCHAVRCMLRVHIAPNTITPHIAPREPITRHETPPHHPLPRALVSCIIFIIFHAASLLLSADSPANFSAFPAAAWGGEGDVGTILDGFRSRALEGVIGDTSCQVFCRLLFTVAPSTPHRSQLSSASSSGSFPPPPPPPPSSSSSSSSLRSFCVGTLGALKFPPESWYRIPYLPVFWPSSLLLC